ncbi:MAG: PD-(D/E)XK nuclease domain-containing protein, partial [Fusobacterium periodonticum]|nr:PD-(D/E)XK nuclease domain-containing protein [Fusobacterium periodonticum]
AFILEFKVAKTENEIDKKIQEALKQIEDKKYDIELKNKNIFDIFKIAFVFYGKKVKVKNL